MKQFASWDWLGNIRELENYVERAVLLTRGKSLEVLLGKLRRASKEASPHNQLQEIRQAAHGTEMQSDGRTVATSMQESSAMRSSRH